MFIHPHQAAEVLAELRSAGLAEGAFVIEQVGGVDVLGLQLTVDEGADPQSLVAAAERRSRDALRVRPEVRVVSSLEEGPVLRDRRSG